MKNDDFLSQITDVEKKAKGLIEKAEKKAKADLQKEESKLASDRAKKMEKSREVAREKLAEKQKSAREMYEKLVTEGAKEAAHLKKEGEGKIDKALAGATLFFTTELLAP